jgi:tRNA G18 (ribose-2'-O)-methylase SpoU
MMETKTTSTTATTNAKRGTDNPLPLTVVLDNIRSAFNVGSVLRTADCAGIDEVITSGYTPVASHHKVKKTSLGAERNVSSTHFDHLETTIQHLRSKTMTIYALEFTENISESLWEEKIDLQPTALIFGNEIDGVQTEITDKHSIKQLHIPMYGKKESLNVANATAIAIYDVVKRWREST